MTETTPGCRFRQVAACKDGVCLVHWNVHERVDKCDQRTEATQRYLESGEYEGEYPA